MFMADQTGSTWSIASHLGVPQHVGAFEISDWYKSDLIYISLVQFYVKKKLDIWTIHTYTLPSVGG